MENKPSVSQHGGMVEWPSALSVLLVNVSCVLEQKLTGDQGTLKLTIYKQNWLYVAFYLF